MNTDRKRRIILKGAIASSAISTLFGTGFAISQSGAINAWPKEAFNAGTMEDALLKLTGDNTVTPNEEQITITAPEIAEGDLAHITIQTTLTDVESIAIFMPGNSPPLVANFNLNPIVTNAITTRIKVENNGNIVAIIKSNNKLYSATKKIQAAAKK